MECSYVGRDLMRALWEAGYHDAEIGATCRSFISNQAHIKNFQGNHFFRIQYIYIYIYIL
jgi:hypothetical protein